MMIKIFPVDDTVNDTVKEPINDKEEPINDKKEPINDEKELINEEKEPINDENGTVNETINLNEDDKLVVELLGKDSAASYDALVLYTHFSRSKITKLIRGLKEKSYRVCGFKKDRILEGCEGMKAVEPSANRVQCLRKVSSRKD